MQVIGHRGAAALAPENTWAAFDVALDLGVDAVETDIHATSDGVLVLIHDATLDRTTNGHGAVCRTPWAEILELDAGYWFDERFRGQRVPALAETLARYGSGTHWVLEIKQEGVQHAVLDLVRERDLLVSTTFISFHFNVVRELRLLEPNAKLGWLVGIYNSHTVTKAVEAGLNQLCPPADLLSDTLFADCEAAGIEVRTWAVRNEETMRRVMSLPVAGMTIDSPDLLLRALGRRDRDYDENAS